MKRFIFFILFFIFNSLTYANDPLLLEISSEDLMDNGIKVYFVLNELTDPKMFFFKGDKPRVVCDFGDVSIKKDLQDEIRVNKEFVQRVRLGEHRQPRKKVRAVLDLVPANKYVVSKMPAVGSTFIVIIRKIDSTEEIPKQTENVAPKKPLRSTASEIFRREMQQEGIVPKNSGTKRVETTMKTEEQIEYFGFIPNKWPIKKNHGEIKMIAHLDTDSNGFSSIKGSILNTSNEYYYQIILEFDIYDYQEDLVGNIRGCFFNIKPGDNRQFLEHIDVKTASRFRIGDMLFW